MAWHEEQLAYDHLVVALGAVSSELGRLGHPGRLVDQTSGGVPAEAPAATTHPPIIGSR